MNDNQENNIKGKKLIPKMLGKTVFIAIIVSIYVAGFAFFAGCIYLYHITHEKGMTKVLLNDVKTQIQNDANNGSIFKDYIREVQKKIKRNWHPPKGDKSTRIVVLFKISRDGRLLKVKINNSENPKADAAAIVAVMKSAPFSPFPAESKDKDVDVQFTFDYNVLNKHDK
jgi:TonB family protein